MAGERGVVAAGVPESVARIEAELLAPGGPFETEEIEVRGQRLRAFTRRARSLREVLVASERHGDAPYVVFSDGDSSRPLTFTQHRRAVASVAAALREHYGVGPGDRVAILAANCPEWIVTFWASVSLGAIAVGLNAWWVGPEIEHAVSDCQPVVVVADRPRLARASTDRLGVPVATVEDDVPAWCDQEAGAPLPDTPIAEDDPALLLYTSGTTGRPKGAINTHRNVIAGLGLQSFHGLRLASLSPPDPAAPPVCQLVTSPLFHVSGLHMAAIAYLTTGVKSVWTQGRFDPVTVMRLIEQHRVTGWSFTPTMLRRVVTHPDVGRYDLSSLQTGGGGGAPFPPALVRATKAALSGLRSTMGVGYGQTECAALATLCSGPELDAFPGSVGRPLPTVEVEIRDASGRVVPDGEEGEVHLRGPMGMPGYWNDPEATTAVLRPEGWLRTGDVGRMEGGRLSLTARRQDLVLRGGENVYPAEIEQCFEEHPAIAEAAVVGVPDPDLGEAVRAVVVPRPGLTVEVAELTGWCPGRIAAFKVPAHWEVRDRPLPRNAAGKVMKHLIDGHEASPMVEDG